MRFSRTKIGLSASILLLWFTGSVLSGCGSKPTRLEADVVAGSGANKDAAGRYLPIVVRVYELKAIGAFQGADFYSLYDNEAETLGADLLAREELNLRPGQQHRLERATAPEALYIGVLGAFREIDIATWKATYALRQGKTNKVEIQIGPSAISIR